MDKPEAIVEVITEPLPEWAAEALAKRQLADVCLLRLRLVAEAVERIDRDRPVASEAVCILEEVLRRRLKVHGDGTG